MKRILLLTAGLLLWAGWSYAQDTPLTQWEFSKDELHWTPVTIPHSYNAQDGHSASYYRGEAYYRTSFEWDGKAQEEPAFLRFEGAAQAAQVVVNGRIVAMHKGGYTPFWVPMRGRGVIQKGTNEVEVICYNMQDLELIPISSDFNKNGGLHNPVALMTLPEVYMDPVTGGFDRFHLIQKKVSAQNAFCDVRTRLVNTSAKAQKVKVKFELKDARGRTVLTKEQTVAVPAGAAVDHAFYFTVSEPHLWNGVKDPYMYTARLTAGSDVSETQVGFRFFSLDKEKGFLLNGESYPLRGVSMHQDHDGKASALAQADYDQDYGFVKELGCNFLRLAHYPHNRYAFGLCDKLGLVVQTEIPWVNICGVRATQAYFDNIHHQMQEMVTSLYNHPSIVFWGMWNELDNWGNKEEFQGMLDARRVVDETNRLYAYAKALDPTRLVGLTDCSLFKREFYTEIKADYYSENMYYGWYRTYNDFTGMTPAVTSVRDRMDGPANLSEYGVGNNPFCHTWKEEDIRRYKEDDRHPEAYANRSHEAHVQQIARMPWLGFTSLWILFDFPVASRKEGYLDSNDGVRYVENPDRMYMNDKGLVTRDRKTRKDVFYLYKAWWNKAVPTVYIAERRLAYRPEGQEFTLTVYSNAASLKVYCNGVEAASAASSGEPSGVIWKFPGMKMGSGPTTFRVVSDGGVEDAVTFEILK